MTNPTNPTNNPKPTLQELWDETIRPFLTIAALIAALLALLLGIPYLEYRAYKERFPDAPAWTFFFQK